MTPWAYFLGLLILSTLLQYALIAIFKKYRLFQPIYALSPDRHQQKKWVPSFGGVGILLTIIIGAVGLKLTSPTIVWCIVSTLIFGLIGFIDDFQSLKKKQNKGLGAKEKFLIQCGVASLLLAVLHLWITPIPSLYLAVLYLFLFVGTSNATNLTDGLDGLLASTMIISLIGMAIVLTPLNVMSFYSPLITISLAGIGGFLIVNWHPAKIFMGDTGSLALGALLASIAITTHPPMLIWVGGIYIAETLCVIAQVAYFKRTNTRIFLMSPLHHHFELLGLSEVQIVTLFSLIQASLIGVALWTL
jgi:phospho-N-acetylmuramoyl-pentapeptide-transferase